MTIPNTARKAGPLLGTGSQTAWPFTFKVFTQADVAVSVTNATGTVTVLALGTDYTVTLNSNQDTSPGGTVNYPVSGAALPVGSAIAIIGDLDYDQSLDLPSGGNFSPTALENQLDRATMQIQQLKELSDRSAKMSVFSSPQDVELLTSSIITLAEIDQEIVAVADNEANVNVVAGNIGSVNTVAANIANVAAAGANTTNINAVVANAADIDTVAANIADVNTVADNINTVNTVADNLSAWRDVTAGDDIQVTNFNGTGFQVAFTLPFSPGVENNTQVYISGVYQQKNTYSVSGTTLTFSVAPPSGTANIEVVWSRPFVLGATDAALVGFQQAGTGAVARTVQGKSRESISAADYSTIANAITAAGTQRDIDLAGASVTPNSIPTNIYGTRFRNGKVLVPSLIAGQDTQLNTYADDANGVLIGRENLAAFMLGCSAATIQNIYIYGDSTVEQNGAYVPKSHEMVARALYACGVNYCATVNRGVSGTSWSDLSALGDLAASTKLIVIKYGINDAVKANALATFAADARSKLTAIRAAANGAATSLSILLMGPSSTYRPSTGQDAKWYEDLRNIYLQLCKEFDCAYFDTYAYLQQTRRAPGFWLDDVGGGEGIHPTPDAAFWIWYEGFKNVVFGDGLWNRQKGNHFWNIAYSGAFPTTEPQLYPFGIRVDFVVTGDGWPASGLLTTIRGAVSGNLGDVRQELTTLDVVPRKFTRTGTGLIWTQWTNVPVAIGSFLNSWANKVGGYNTAGYMVHDDGFVELYGTVTGGTIGVSLFQLPANARPGFAHTFATSGAASGSYAVANVVVFGDGNIVPYAAANTTISLDGIRFRHGA
jgi:hypothetical protein